MIAGRAIAARSQLLPEEGLPPLPEPGRFFGFRVNMAGETVLRLQRRPSWLATIVRSALSTLPSWLMS